MSKITDATSHGDAASSLDRAIEMFARGDPVCVHDAADREGETDLIYPAEAVTPEAVVRMRNDAGGLICLALTHDVADAFDLPYVTDALDHPATDGHDLGYDDRSSFSLTVNHRDTFTGITDTDRSLTIRELGRAAADPAAVDFAATFRIPGHVHVLRGAPDLLAQREGHTELGLALAAAAGREPAVVVCEMLDDETGEARTPQDASQYAADNALAYLEGSEIVDRLG